MDKLFKTAVAEPDTSPLPGDIVIFWRGSPASWEGHVGIFFGFSYEGTRAHLQLPL